ncbi:hypothetical protein [Zavarzinia compransoris]|uniref:Phospholipase/carboxylesterase/thioesterase domain-containing protein n=1 Tax=Zavarzinia compransoris TaxID=1264899 RepID=A0A317E4X3_9PROT|nr:hypothetical protein [Zavarzinia compransoris]PWR22178.1 hypothetical protein DKG75_09435 [Zavarzinia compransoris]TDP47069.1 hypothetical protein DES42_103237 [Zavarzinia compransoris]
MGINRRHLVAGGLALLAGACAGTPPPVTAGGRRLDFGEEMDDGTRVVVPAGLEPEGRAAVVFLPATDGTAPQLYRYYAEMHAARGGFVAFLPPGSSSAADYGSGERFAATVALWDERVRELMGRHRRRFAVDPARVGLAGFSLGGDLSWALAQTSPEAYCGAVVMGSRCGYRAPHALSLLAFRGFRFALIRGADESGARAGGMAAARRLLADEGIAHFYDEVPGAHVRAPPPAFMQAVDFILGPAPVAGRPMARTLG